MVQCIEYTRASTNNQEYSVGDQDKSIRDWARRNKYKIVKSYCDDGISGHYAAKRPGFLSMIEDVTTGKYPDIKALLIWDSYRFARNMVEFLTYKQMIQQHGISVIAVSEPIVQDDDAQLYIDAINGASGELYLRKLSKDSRRGIRAKVVERHEHIGKCPFGYMMKDGALVADPGRAPWVKYMFDAVEAGAPYLQICHALNDNMVYSVNGAQWCVATLKYALQNRTYCGQIEATLSGDHGIYDGKHPAIITPEQFDRVQNVMAERAAKRKKYEQSTNQYVHWLSGLVRCPICGRSMSHVKCPGGRKPAYRCNGYVGGQLCTNGSARVWIIEQAVYRELERIYTEPDAIETAKINVVHPKASIDYDSEISKLEKQLDRAKRAYIEEIDTLEEYRENKTRLTDAINEMKKKKAAAPAADSVIPDDFRARCRDVLTFLKSDAPMDEKAAVAHGLIEKVCPDSRAKTITIYFYA